jgi:hypothetical protein
VLLHHLPPESALNTAMRNNTPDRDIATSGEDPALGKWSSLEVLLAALIDEVRFVGWAYVQSHTERSVPRPPPVPRPGMASRQRGKLMSLEDAQKLDPRLRGMSLEEAQAAMDRMTGRGR